MEKGDDLYVRLHIGSKGRIVPEYRIDSEERKFVDENTIYLIYKIKKIDPEELRQIQLEKEQERLKWEEERRFKEWARQPY